MSMDLNLIRKSLREAEEVRWENFTRIENTTLRELINDFATMRDRIDDLELRLASAISERDDYRSRIDAMFWCEACDRLEIERKVDSVSMERASVVAWLHREAIRKEAGAIPWDDSELRQAAYSIERGEHRREGER